MAVENIADVFFWVSWAALIILTMRDFLRTKKIGYSLSYAALLLTWGWIYLSLFQSSSQVRPKGDEGHQWAFMVVLYACMLAGMAANYLYRRWDDPKPKRRPFDLGNLLAPVVVSPIVFIPLLGAFQSAYVDLSKLTAPKLMIFLVTFENGFFWKGFFDTRRRGQML